MQYSEHLRLKENQTIEQFYLPKQELTLETFNKQMKLPQKMKKNFIVAVQVLLFLSIVPKINYAQNIDWKGIYVFEEESWDDEGTPSNRWFRLIVKEVKGKLQAVYSDGANSQVWKCFSLKVKTKGTMANFYFEKNLDCRSGFKKGDLVLKLKKKEGKKLETIWGKINLGAYSELGGLQEDGVFFRKVAEK